MERRRVAVYGLGLCLLCLLGAPPLHADANGDFAAEPQRTVGPAERIVPAGPGAADAGRGLLSLGFIGVGVPPEGDSPAEIAFTPDAAQIVIAHRDTKNLVVFDAATRQVLRVIAVSGSPNSLAFTPNGQYIVTANLFEDTVSIIDFASGTEVRTVPVGDQPGIIRVTADGTKAVVGETVVSTLSVIDIASGAILRTIPNCKFWALTSFGAWGIVYKFTDFEITPDSQTLIFPDPFSNQIVFGDLATGNAVRVTATKAATIDLARDGTLAVVAADYPNTDVYVVDVAAQAITATINTGGPATSVPPIALSGDKSKAAVAIQNAVKIVRLGNQTVSAALNVAGVGGLATLADGDYVAVNNYMGSLVSFPAETIVASFMNSTIPDAFVVAPNGWRVATAHALRKEVMEVINMNPQGGSLEGVVPTGPAPEGDRARNVALTSDSQKAVVLNNHSWNAMILDLPTQTIQHVAPVGERPGAVAITPGNAKAVVANLDSSFATVIDLASGAATNVAISRRQSKVAISPDGVYAYIPVVADGDGVWRINLNTLLPEGPKILTGDMGGIAMGLDEASGMALSPGGATVVTCGSFSNTVSLIDTATWTLLKNLAVGTFPVQAVFSPDGTRLYVSNKNSNNVSVIDATTWTPITTVAVGQAPGRMAINSTATRLYVGNYTGKSVSVLDLTSNTLLATIPLPAGTSGGEALYLQLSGDGKYLYVAANGGNVSRIDTSTNTVVEYINIGAVPADLGWSDALQTAFIPSPYGGDGLHMVRVGKKGDLNCDGAVDFFDINPFVLALSDPAGYAAQYPNCTIANGDVNGDGKTDFFDINPFVALLTQP